MACNESLDFQQAISRALQRLPTPSMVFQTFNSPLALCTHEIQYAMSSFNVLSDRALILDASLSWLAFLPNNATLWWL